MPLKVLQVGNAQLLPPNSNTCLLTSPCHADDGLLLLLQGTVLAASTELLGPPNIAEFCITSSAYLSGTGSWNVVHGKCFSISSLLLMTWTCCLGSRSDDWMEYH